MWVVWVTYYSITYSGPMCVCVYVCGARDEPRALKMLVKQVCYSWSYTLAILQTSYFETGSLSQLDRENCEVEIFGLLDNSIVSHDVFLKNRCLRGHTMFKKNYINGTPPTERTFLNCYTMRHFGLCWSSLHGEMHTKELLVYSSWFQLIPAASDDLDWFGRALSSLLGRAITTDSYW